MVDELVHYGFSRNINPKIILQIILSPFKIDFPWIYESGLSLLEKINKVKDIQFTKSYEEFMGLIDFTFENPIFRETFREEYEYRYYREIPYLIERYFKELEYRKIKSENIW